MRVNKKDLEDGKVLYMWIENWILNGSGDGELWMDDDLEYALSRNPSHKLFKVTLEEVEIEKYEDQEVTTVTKTRVKKDGIDMSIRQRRAEETNPNNT